MNQFAGFIIVISSTTFYALMYPLLKKTGEQVPPFAVVAITSLIVFAISFLSSVFFEGFFSIKTGSIRANVPILILAGVINLFAYWLLLLSYKHFPVWQVTMFSLLTPVISGVFAYYLLGEKMTANLFIGLVIMSVGLFVALRP